MTAELEPRVRQALDEAYGFLTPEATVEIRRAGINALSRRLPDGIECEDTSIAGVPVRWVRPTWSKSPQIVLAVHGGGFHVGSVESHRDLAGHVAAASGAQVVIIDYRLSPEDVYPAALDDVKAVYRALLEQGVAPTDLALLGDSSGGGLSLSAVLALKDEHVPMPAGIVVMSAWVDQTLASPSIKGRAGLDPFQNEAAYIRVGSAYRAGVPADDPYVSPIFGDLRGLPPMLMQVGTHEPLHDDTVRFAERAGEAGVIVEIQVEEGMPHMHQMLLWNLPEAADSARRAGAFIRSLTLR